MWKNNRVFIISVCSVICLSVLIIIFAASCSGTTIEFIADYYFVCYRITDNSVSASSISGTVSSYGGAGYILEHDGNYYITVSCYYTENDAETVCSSLKKRDLECTVLNISIEEKTVKSSARKNSALFKGNLTTLDSLSRLAYECANGLDTGQINQNGADEVINAIENGLNGLLRANADNCFTESIKLLLAECSDRKSGYIYSKDMRYLQIAVTDIIINTELY